MATQEKLQHRLEELYNSGFEVVDGEPDITGWVARSRSGKKVGKVNDLLFESQTRKVRYIILDLDNNELGLDDRKVLIPIGMAELYMKGRDYKHRGDPAHTAYDPANDANVVFLPMVTAQQLDELPTYERHRLSPHIEMAIRKILEPRTDSLRHDEDEFYRHEHFNDDKFYNP